MSQKKWHPFTFALAMKIALFYICSSYVKYWPIFVIFDVMKQEVTSIIVVI